MARIAILTNEFTPYPGGVARYCAEIAAEAANLGHQVTVFAPSYGHANLLDERPGFKITRFSGGLFKLNPYSFCLLLMQLQFLFRNNTFDVVHAADWPMVLALNFIPAGSEKRMMTIYGSDVFTILHSRRARLFASRRAIKKFELYLAISRFSKGLFCQHTKGIDYSRVHVAHLGVSQFWQGPPLTSVLARVKDEYFQSKDTITILTVARIQKRKGQLLTIESISFLPLSLRSRVRYICIGRAVDAELLETMKAESAVRGVNFCYIEPLPDEEIKAFFACADLFALTALDTSSDVEGFGLVLLEAASQGLPAVVTKTHAISEVVVDGVTGWVIDSYDARDISAKLQSLLEDLGALSAMSPDCIKHSETFTWKKCAIGTYGLP